MRWRRPRAAWRTRFWRRISPLSQANLLPQEASDWDGIRATVEQAAPLVKGGHFQLRDVYLLDASDQTATADTQFFCSNATGSLTVTINMTALPPGRYAVALADAAGAPLAGQMGVVLAWDGAATAWKLAGLTVRPGMFDGHDGVWYWVRARELAKTDPWGAWFSYDAARYLLLPVDFLSSPNLQKLRQEQSLISPSPQSAVSVVVARWRPHLEDRGGGTSIPRCTSRTWAWCTSRQA